jgi:excisionase family DNA binding protein
MIGQVIVMTPEQLEGYIFQAFEKAATRYAPLPVVPTAKSDTEELITRQEAADILKVKSLVTIDNLTKKGLLKKHRLGGVVRFKRGEVIAFSNQTKKDRK